MWRTGADSLQDIAAWVGRRSNDPDGRFLIVAREDDPVGFIQLTKIDRTDGHAYLGMLIDPAERRQGLASQALRAMERLGREEIGLHKIQLEVLVDNASALRFWTRAGYRAVGTLRGHHLHGGTRHDVALLEKIVTDSASDQTKESHVLPAIPNDANLIEAMASDPEVQELRARLFSLMGKYKYAYNWTWYGRPVIQLPQDVMAMQTLILQNKPDLIIETGIAHGGSLILSASMLELLGEGQVLGVDIDIRPHNRQAIESHPLARRISMIQGSSIDPAVADEVRARAASARRVMVCLDSNHTADHVARELELYAPLVSVGQYLAVFDTAVELLSPEECADRPWGPGNSPMTAVRAFLAKNSSFVVDRELEARLLFTVAPEGYLKRLA
jgi:cephalosporin hydroxylase/RimJ/RimL family protein N-acetyltransferase